MNEQPAVVNMETYVTALQGLEKIFQSTGAGKWKEDIEYCLHQWQEKQSLRMFHSLSGNSKDGLAAVYISSQAGYRVQAQLEPWINTLLKCLDVIARISSRTQEMGKTFTPEQVRTVMTHDTRFDLNGWYCFDCGHGETGDHEIDWFLYHHCMRNAVFEALENDDLMHFVNITLSGNVPEIRQEKREMSNLLRDSKITHNTRSGRMRPCPKCRSDNTGLHSWRYDYDQVAFIAREVPENADAE